jgi:N utilization substance protein B
LSATRSRSRQLALQVLYAADVARRGAELEPATVEEALEGAVAHFERAEGAIGYAAELVRGVAAHRAAIDARITAAATNWRLDRMAVVDRNVLRLAVYEMEWAGLPPSVAIDEAVELVRRFGADPSPAFVNGVLDGVARALRACEPERAGSAQP